MKLPAYMMATKAYHQTGDISSDTSDICRVFSEDESNYIGNWVCGLGFMNVKFPKETTRELTQEEKDYWNGQMVELSGIIRSLIIEGATNSIKIPTNSFIVKTKNSTYAFAQVDPEGMRSWAKNGQPENGNCKLYSLVRGKSLLIMADNFRQIRTTPIQEVIF